MAQQQEARPPGLILGLLTLPLRLVGVLGGSLLLSILIECLGVYALWPQQSWHHAQGMLEFELRQLSDHFGRSLLVSDPVQTIERIIVTAYEHVFVRSGLLAWAKPSPTSSNTVHLKGLQHILVLARDGVKPYALAAAYTLLTFLARLMVLFLAAPLFVLSALIDLTDGLVRRDVRRFGAGYESGFVHHRARATVMPLAVLPAVTYLALPVSVHPLLILLPGAILLSLAVNITVGSFKKYL